MAAVADAWNGAYSSSLTPSPVQLAQMSVTGTFLHSPPLHSCCAARTHGMLAQTALILLESGTVLIQGNDEKMSAPGEQCHGKSH